MFEFNPSDTSLRRLLREHLRGSRKVAKSLAALLVDDTKIRAHVSCVNDEKTHPDIVSHWCIQNMTPPPLGAPGVKYLSFRPTQSLEESSAVYTRRGVEKM